MDERSRQHHHTHTHDHDHTHPRPPGRRLTLCLAGIALLLAFGFTTPAATEQARPEAEAADRAPEAMSELAPWAGHWKGQGWIRMGPGEPVKIDSEEWIESRLDGAALVIEGKHHAQADGRRVHHALALLSWDEAAGTFRFRTHVAGRGPGDFTGHVEDGAFVWGGPMGDPEGAGRMRYTIRIEDGTWHEVGDFSRDGETWNRFFEMTLKKVG